MGSQNDLNTFAHIFQLYNFIMIVVSDESIDKALEELNQLKEEDANNLMERLSQEQPVMVAYIAAMAENFEDQEIQDLFLYYFLAIWKAFTIETGNMPQVSEAQMEEADAKNNELLDAMEAQGENANPENYFLQVNQEPLVAFITTELMEPDEELPLDEVAQGAIFSFLNVIIDGFDIAINKPTMRVNR